MTHTRPPVIAEWLLVRCGVDEALVGDLREAFRAHCCSTWYWRQTLAALVVACRASLLQHHLQIPRRFAASTAVLAALVYASACGQKVDVATGVKVEGVTTGWKKVEVSAGTKLVPAVAFRLTNVSQQALPVLQVNAIFRRGNEASEWGNDFRRASGSDGLPPGSSTRDFELASLLGYTGAQAPSDMLANSHFVDATVDLFGKYGSTPWVKLGEFPIERALLVP